jgi:hypothetical protein
MSRKLGGCGLSRNAAIRLLVGLRDDLERRYALYRSARHPEDEQFFRYLLSIADEAVTHRFFFVVDDSTSPDDLFIIDFRHERDPN